MSFPESACSRSFQHVRRTLAVACVFLLTVGNAAVGQSRLIDFEDIHTADFATNGGMPSPRPMLPLPPVVIGNGYAGLDWTHFYAIDGPLVGDQVDNAAPHSSAVSGYNEAISYTSEARISAATPFDLTSGFFNSLNAFNLSLEIQGYNGSTLLYDQYFTLAPADPATLSLYYTNLQSFCFSPSPQLLELNMVGITDARFIVSGGQSVRYNESGGIFAIDDLTVAPEPSTLALGVAGFVAAVGLRRLRTPSRK